MNTLYLKYAVEVEKTGSISQAAENLFMAQPNLSKAIKELESDFGIAIFERSSRGVRLTNKGREFLNYAESILAQLDKMELLSKEIETQIPNFNVSLPRDSCMAEAAANFLSAVGDKIMNAAIRESNSIQAIAGVADGSFELGVIRCKKAFESYFLEYLAEKRLETMPLWDFREVFLTSQKSALANEKKIREQELDNLIEIAYCDSDIPYANIGKKHIDDGTSRKITVYERSASFELLSEISGTFMRSAPVPKKILERYELIQSEFDGDIYTDQLIFRKGYKLSENDKLFVEKLYSAKEEAK